MAMKAPPERFHAHETFAAPQAPLRHVEPSTTGGRDVFGNRVIPSQRLAYGDIEDRPTKAAMLITPEGERFIRSYPGILTRLDRALRALRSAAHGKAARSRPRSAELAQGVTLTRLGEGNQSEAFRLDTPSGTWVVKVHCGHGLHSQPYVNEMLQMQALARENIDGYARLGVAFPRILFASGQVLCEEFVPEPALPTSDFAATVYAAAAITEDAIARQKASGNPLWHRIHVDKSHSPSAPPIDNFRLRADGTIVWIDPLAVFSDSGPRLPDAHLTPAEIALLPRSSPEEMRTRYASAERDLHRLIADIEGFPEDDDEAWIANAQHAFRKAGIEPDPDPTYLSSDYLAAKRAILKRHGVRWVFSA